MTPVSEAAALTAFHKSCNEQKFNGGVWVNMPGGLTFRVHVVPPGLGRNGNDEKWLLDLILEDP